MKRIRTPEDEGYTLPPAPASCPFDLDNIKNERALDSLGYYLVYADEPEMVLIFRRKDDRGEIGIDAKHYQVWITEEDEDGREQHKRPDDDDHLAYMLALDSAGVLDEEPHMVFI